MSGDIEGQLPLDAFRPFFDAAVALVDEAKLRFGPDGLSWKGVDPANVVMFDASLSADAFDSYEADEGVVGIGLSHVEDFLDTCSDDDVLHVETTGDQAIRFSADGFEFTKDWIDPGKLRAEPDLPDLDLPGVVVLQGGRFEQAMERCDIAGHHVQFSIDPDPWTFQAAAEGDTETGVFESDVEAVDEPAEVGTLYSLDYLTDMADAIPADVLCRLHLGDEFPLRMEYPIAGGDGQVELLLAPRVKK